MQQHPSYNRPDWANDGFEMVRLRRWLFRLGGFLAPALIATGLLGGALFRLLDRQEDLEAQIRALQAVKPGPEQVQDLRGDLERLNQQVQTLNGQVPQNLSSQISTLETRLSELDTQIDQVNTRAEAAVTQEQLNQALQGLQNRTPAASPSPNNP